MRTPEELFSKEFQTDMTELDELLTKEGIKHELREHPAFLREKRVKDLIGYYPVGEWQIIIDNNFSVIRGSCSFGDYEIMNIGKGDKFKNSERFSTPEELIKVLQS